MNTRVVDQLTGKRVALALSAGFFGFYHQAGVLQALTDFGIRPNHISGNSAGAIVASMYASGREPSEIRDDLLSLSRNDFWDPTWPLSRLGFGFLRGKKFRSQLERVLSSRSFDTCRIPLTVGVYHIDSGRMRHIDSGPLVPAVYASCALPYLFMPQVIGGERYWDGGFAEKTPLVSFLENPDVDTVVVSYLPQRDAAKRQLLPFMPQQFSVFADVPYEERVERDQMGVRLLREAGKEVVVIAPDSHRLGPFTLDQAGEAYRGGFEGTKVILESVGDTSLGSPELF